MKNRQIIQMIKQKANEKYVPDVRDMIKEQLNINQQVVSSPKKVFRFRAVYASFALILATSLVFILVLVNQTPDIDLFNDSNFSDQVILSTISTVELVDSELVLENKESHNILLADEDDYVENQIDEVLKYTEFMETLLNNPDDYQRQFVDKTYGNYEKVMIYEFLDMTGQTQIYEFYYEQDINHKNNTYQINGALVIDEKVYDITIEGVIDGDSFTLTHQVNEDRKINATFQINQFLNRLTFRQYFQNNIEKEAVITYGNKEQATLTFVKGQAKGTYQFTMDELPSNGKAMRIHYQIGSVDQGSIEVRVDQSNNNQYILDITPDNRPPFVEQRDRPTPPKYGDGPGNGRN